MTQIKTFRFIHAEITLYNVCSVHRRMFRTLVGVQYIVGCSVHWGYPVHREMFSTLGVFSTSGDTMSDTMSTSVGYHEYIGGVQYIG